MITKLLHRHTKNETMTTKTTTTMMTTTTTTTITTTATTTLKLRHSDRVLILLHMSVSFSSQSQASLCEPCTVTTGIHIFLSVSISFLVVAGYWLSYSYKCFLVLWESQNLCMHCQKYHILWFGNTWDIWLPEPNFVGHWATAL